MTATEALDHLAQRLIQAERDVALLEGAVDHAQTERTLLRKDLDIVIDVLTKVVSHIHETKTTKRRSAKSTTKKGK